jgi:hypothetical protein
MRSPLVTNRSPLGLRGVALTLALLVPTLAPALGRAEDGARAGALFDEGRKLLDQGNVAGACGKFAESQQLEPAVGTLLNLAACEEQRGQLLEASRQWKAAVSLARSTRDERVAEAERRSRTLDERIPRLTVRLALGSPAGTSLRLVPAVGSERELESGTSERVDPGKCRVVVSAPGRQERSYDVELLAGKESTLEAEPGGPTDGASDGGSTSWTPVNSAGAVLGGLGVISVIVGAVFGSKALSKQDEATPYCDANNLCDQTGVDLRDEGLTAARVSTATIVIGGLLLAGGVALMLVPAPEEPVVVPADAGRGSSRPPTLALRVGANGAALVGAW